jgi:hypothetical protein
MISTKTENIRRFAYLSYDDTCLIKCMSSVSSTLVSYASKIGIVLSFPKNQTLIPSIQEKTLGELL